MSILQRLFGTSAPVATPEPETQERSSGLLAFSTHLRRNPQEIADTASKRIRDAAPSPETAGTAMDGVGNFASRFKGLNRGDIPEELYSWFVAQTFFGHQMAAMMAQHWLIDKACEMPAKDAVRKGFAVNIEGLPADKEGQVHDLINKASKRYALNGKMREWVHKGRVFGIRIALFKVESTQANYYELPFNPDAIAPGTFRGVVQMDPYWCAPELSQAGSIDPTSPDFYEPTWWMIGGKRYHKSHLAIFRTSIPADILKPVYMYGGIPLPQQIMERVYAAERTANEGPQLAMTKRLTVWTTDVSELLLNQDKFAEHMVNFMALRDNYGLKINGLDDTMAQFDTTLAGFVELVDQQYQIVSAIARVPSTKLMGMSPPGGLDGGGEYEEAAYHEELETIQEDLSGSFLDKYFTCLLRSEIEPKAGLRQGSLTVTVDWEPLDSPTAKELAETNKLKAETGAALIASGAIDGQDERNRIRKDPDSGYAGIEATSLLDEAEEELEAATLALTAADPNAEADPLDAATAALTDG